MKANRVSFQTAPDIDGFPEEILSATSAHCGLPQRCPHSHLQKRGHQTPSVRKQHHGAL